MCSLLFLVSRLLFFFFVFFVFLLLFVRGCLVLVVGCWLLVVGCWVLTKHKIVKTHWFLQATSTTQGRVMQVDVTLLLGRRLQVYGTLLQGRVVQVDVTLLFGWLVHVCAQVENHLFLQEFWHRSKIIVFTRVFARYLTQCSR